jgi:hypothetical protein
MSLPLPLSVRLVTSRIDRYVTADLRSLRFQSVAVGGFASLQMSLDRPLALRPDEIAYYGRVYVYYGPRTVWEGRLEDPGRSAGRDGQVWDLVAVGPAAHTLDRTIPYIAADRRLDSWTVGGASTSPSYLRIDKRVDEDGTAVIQVQAPSGVTFLAGAAGLVTYPAIADAGQQLGRVNVSWRSGFTSASNDARLGTSIGSGATTAVETDVVSVTSGTLTGSRGGANPITAGHDTARLRFQRNTTNQAGGDTVWLEFTNPAVRSLLKDRTGADITSGYSADTVLLSELVADWLGRYLPLYDGATAQIATTSYAIQQLAYPDGATVGQMLADGLVLEPGYRWGAWESNSAGLYRFEFGAWPTTVRYEADITDGYTSTGSADGLYNEVRVVYMGADGQTKTTVRTSSVPDLTAAGLTRTHLLDLGTKIMSLADAQRAGDQFLAEHQYAPNAGRLTLARPILDLQRGCMVMPWEIVPGNLIRVRGILPRIDALNASARDGVTVFKIWSTEFDASRAAAELELDSWSLSTARSLATAAGRRIRRR